MLVDARFPTQNHRGQQFNGYSYRSAAMGCTVAARRAGK